MASDFEEYRQQAEYCMAIARKVRSNALKADWLRLAADWLEMVPDPVSASQKFDNAVEHTGTSHESSSSEH